MSRGGVVAVGLAYLLGVAACSSSAHSPAVEGTGGVAGAGSGGAPGGSGGSAGAAGSGGVAGSDAGADAEPPLIETIKVQDPSGNPVQAIVFSSTPEGAVFAETWTEQDGTAQLDVPPGGSVSAWRDKFVGPGTERYLTTETRVVQGGTVVLPVVSFVDEPKPTQSVTLQLGTLPAGTTSLQVVLPCMTVNRSPSATLQIDDYTYCDESQTLLDILVVARNAAGKIVGTATSFANTFNPTEPGPAYSLSTFTSNVTEMVAAIDGAPAGSNVTLSVGAYRQANPMLLLEQFATPGPPVSHTFELPPALDRARFRQTVSWTDGNVTRVVDRQDTLSSIPPTTTWTFPGSGQGVESLKPWDVSDPKRPKLGWTLGAGNPGACVASINFISDAEGLLVIMRADAASATGFQLPELPSAIAGLAPTAGATLDLQFAGVFSGSSAEKRCFPLLDEDAQQFSVNGARIADGK